jgi:cobyrinic acid a,c-diamide synthase
VRGLLVAGTASGVGKTTVAHAIMAGFRRRGLVVQPFKCGPDFLDTAHHTRACERPARNLDTWLFSPEVNRSVLREAVGDADIVVAEGMMGLFDGKSGETDAGSSAEIARLLRLPVVLVVDAAKSGRSVAAVVLGFERFDSEIEIAGVILNRVANARHFQMLATAIERVCKTKVMGWLPHETKIAIAERHLGLHGVAEQTAGAHDARVEVLADLAEQYFALESLMSLRCGLEMTAARVVRSKARPLLDEVRIGVAFDAAFSFYYEDNLDLLREQGATIIRFSPLDDSSLPAGLDALYFGGGYPEIFAAQLSANTAMTEQIRAFAASEKPIYAECGGMMYLSKTLRTRDGKTYPMADVLPLDIEMTDRLVQFGYVTVEFTEDCLLGDKGTEIRGHSFHYSRITQRTSVDTSYKVRYSLSGNEDSEGFHYRSVLGSYIHLHFRANPTVARCFVAATRSARSLQAVTA